MSPRLQASGISVFRGDRLVLRDVDLAVPEGGALLLLGPNGAGKSTLLRALAGLKRLDAGTITFDGTTDYAGQAAYLGHQDAIKPGLTTLENLAFAAAISGADRQGALDALGLRALADLPARMLSAGQKRRLALARLAVGAHKLWLLDEPTVGLDDASLHRLAALLATHRATGGVVVAATHLALPLPGATELRLGA